jgi:hypothetical protein
MSDFLSVSDVRQWMRLETTAADDHITEALNAAEAWVARHAGVAFAQASREETISGPGDDLTVAYAPIISITSVTDEAISEDVDGDDLGFSGNRVYRFSGGQRISWGRGINRWRVKYVGGYTGATGTTPAPTGLRVPILTLARQYYLDGTIGGVAPEILESLGPFVWRVF